MTCTSTSVLPFSSTFNLAQSATLNSHYLLCPERDAQPSYPYWDATDACCAAINGHGPRDDVAYLDSVIDAANAHGFDSSRIVLLGLSNGAFMAHRYACERGNRIKGIIAVNGVSWYDFAAHCSQNNYTPDILQVSAISDPIVYYNGGNLGSGAYPGAELTTQRWAQRSGCTDSLTATHIGVDSYITVAGMTYRREFSCPHNRVADWAMGEGGHLPPFNDQFIPMALEFMGFVN